MLHTMKQLVPLEGNINKTLWEALKTPPRTSLFIKIKVVIKTSLEIILYICNEKYFSNNFNIDTL